MPGATKPVTKSGDLPANAALSLVLNSQQNPLAVNPTVGRIPELDAVAPHGIAILTDQVEAVYQTGQQDLNANRVARALQRFTEAQSLLIESDFDVQSDPRLATLYSRIMDGIIRSDQAASAQGLDLSADPQTTPAPPAPLDVITSLTPAPEEGAAPVDPGLAHQRRGRVATGAHDLPMTVNDIVVLSYLNFFQTTHGRAIVETGLRRAGTLPSHDRRGFARGGFAERPDVHGTGRIVPSSRRRFHALARAACGNSCRSAASSTDWNTATG
jgi:hypothetical protein